MESSKKNKKIYFLILLFYLSNFCNKPKLNTLKNITYDQVANDKQKIYKKSGKKNLNIVDGDTIHLRGIKYRLFGIDAPEITQKCRKKSKSYNCGLNAKLFLESQIKDHKKLQCKKKDVDRYNRVVAVCFYEGIDLNRIMVRSGWALAYKKYSQSYVNDEKFAKNKKLGMWNGSFEKPSEWRKNKKSSVFKNN